MKKTIYLLVSVILLFSCKKATTTPPTNTPNSVACVDNPNINFKSIGGTPIGKFGECIKDIDGNIYKTVTIGSQTWMAENLKVSKYNDGTAIPNITGEQGWSNLTTGAWSFYNNDVANNAKYGKLYNWYAVSPITNGNKNICPTGWRVPSDIDWGELIEYLGGANIAGGKMKEGGTTNWNSPNTDATNTSLFTGLPGANRDDDGDYDGSIGGGGGWWSSTEVDTNDTWFRFLTNEDGKASRYAIGKRFGFSVRCLKD
jgi:uncharacterized protein (TIGR02145 family)